MLKYYDNNNNYSYLDEFLTPVLILLILALVGADLCSVVMFLPHDVQDLSRFVHHLLTLELPLRPRVARPHLSLQDSAARRVREDHVIEGRLDEPLLVLVPQLILLGG